MITGRNYKLHGIDWNLGVLSVADLFLAQIQNARGENHAAGFTVLKFSFGKKRFQSPLWAFQTRKQLNFFFVLYCFFFIYISVQELQQLQKQIITGIAC